MLAERACERLITEFVRRLDLGDPGTVAELFTPDGVWEWPHGGRRVAGRDDLRAYFGSRPADRLSRRLCTTTLVTVESATTARATSYLATYRVDGYTGGMIPPRLPANVGHYEGHLSQRRRAVAARVPDHRPAVRRSDGAPRRRPAQALTGRKIRGP